MTHYASIYPAGGDASVLEREVADLRLRHKRGDHAVALARVEVLLERYPENRDLLLIAAGALRHLGQTEAALARLDTLAAAQPGYSRLHQERGLCHIARQDAPAAIAALLQAVNINPALPQSWRMLEGVYRLTGQVGEAATCAAQSATLAGLPPQVVAATALFHDGELAAAEAMIRAFLLEHHAPARGDHPEAMRLLAKIGMAREVWDDAEALLAGVLAAMPDHRTARAEYVQTLLQRYKHREAEVALEPLLAADFGNIEYRILASSIAVGLGRQEEAIALYRDLLADLPEHAAPGQDARALAATRADLYLWLGHALKTVGELADAIGAYHAAAFTRPDFGDAWWSLANLKTYRFVEAEIDTMRAAEANPATGDTDRVHLAFALGKAFEDRGDYASSWSHYASGNAIQRARSRYRPEIFETNTREQKRICTAGFFAAREGWGVADPDPIFIVGLPRAGSTLIEQILASHSGVEGTQELPDIQRFAQAMQGRDPDFVHPRYPAALADLTRPDVRAMGERFLADTRSQRVLGRRLFIDKMPNNFRHIGLIHLILPNATIIDARREPMACCFSNLKQLFAQGQEFAYSADDIARYYRTYLELMHHWDAVLPGKVLRVIHEDVVDDLETQVRRILAHCGLGFEPGCLAFHETKRAVRTPSSEQVRRPINRDGMEQWRPFEPWLEPLKAALGDALTDWRTG